MSALEAASYAVYTLCVGLWTGSVLFVALTVVPMARDGALDAAPVNALTGALSRVSRLSAVAVLLTGVSVGVARDTVGSLTGTTRGYLLVAVAVLWVVLAGTVEVGTGRLRDGTERDKVREPARAARPPLLVASLAAALLLVVSGLLGATRLGLL